MAEVEQSLFNYKMVAFYFNGFFRRECMEQRYNKQI